MIWMGTASTTWLSVLRALKTDAATSRIPVVILSNLGQESDVQAALGAGAAAYLLKADLSLQDLIKRVEEVLQREV